MAGWPRLTTKGETANVQLPNPHLFTPSADKGCERQGRRTGKIEAPRQRRVVIETGHRAGYQAARLQAAGYGFLQARGLRQTLGRSHGRVCLSGMVGGSVPELERGPGAGR